MEVKDLLYNHRRTLLYRKTHFRKRSLIGLTHVQISVFAHCTQLCMTLMQHLSHISSTKMHNYSNYGCCYPEFSLVIQIYITGCCSQPALSLSKCFMCGGGSRLCIMLFLSSPSDGTCLELWIYQLFISHYQAI